MVGTWSPRIPNSLKDVLRRAAPLRVAVNQYRAHRLAAGPKRLDACAAQFAMNLHLTGAAPLEGKVCLEIGAGWVLSHALVCHLLGAQRIIVTDLSAIAHPQTLSKALSTSSLSLVRDILAPFSDHSDLRARLEGLAAVQSWDFETLRRLGIEYQAPVDLSHGWSGPKADFIYSFSVLEHVAVDEIDALLATLGDALLPGGHMLHNVHLEDHKAIASDPLRFLQEPSASYGRALQNDRGNRVRSSQWQRRFDQLPGLSTDLFYAWQRLDKPLPSTIDPSIEHTGEDDLRTSHIGIHSVRVASDAEPTA